MTDAAASIPAANDATASIARRRDDERGPRRPPVPPDADLRHFPKVPILAQRLFDSRFNTIANDVEFRAGLNLWLKSWFQIPAGSLPNDDYELCKLSGHGENIQGWLLVKPTALHGWYLGTDTRLYHKVVAEVVNDALQFSKKQSDKAAKRWAGHTKKPTTPKRPKPDKPDTSKPAKKKKKHAVASPHAAAAQRLSTAMDAIKACQGLELNGLERSTDISTGVGISPSVGAESASAGEATTPTSPVFIRYPLLQQDDGPIPFLDITEAMVERWSTTYPKVDVRQALHELHLWADQNAEKRKTEKFAPIHITRCLEGRQRRADLDQYRRPAGAPATPAAPDYTKGQAINRRSFLDDDT